MSSLPPSRPPFSASDAAFAGLRLCRREPLTVLVWSALSLVLFGGLGALMAATIGPQLMALQAQAAAGQAHVDPARTMALLGAIAPAYSLILLVSIAFYALIYAAVNRAILRPAGRPGRLGFGVDELLQLAVLLVVWLALFVVYLVGLVVVLLASVLVGLASRPAGTLVGALGIVAVIAGIVFVMVRLSLASPLALDRRQLDLKAAWALTRGRFWSLLGAYVLAFLIAMLLSLAVTVVFTAIAAAIGGLGGASAVFRPDMTSLSSYFTGAMIAWIVVASGLYGLVFAVVLGAPADAYRQLSGAASGAPSIASTAADRSAAFGARV